MHRASKTSNSCALSFDMIQIQCRVVLYYGAITSKHVCIVGCVLTCDPHNVELTMLNVLLYYCVKVLNPGLYIVCALKCVCKLGKIQFWYVKLFTTNFTFTTAGTGRCYSYMHDW